VVHAGEMEKGVGAGQGGELSLSLSARLQRGERGSKMGEGTTGGKGLARGKGKWRRVRVGEGDK
jgi:hypothetical protein